MPSQPKPSETTDGLRVLSTLATQVAWPAIVGPFEAETGCRVDTVFGPTNALLARLAAGEAADLLIVTREAADQLAGEGRIGERADIALSWVGLAVKAGAPRPDIATPEALVAALAAARSIAYSRIGASGVLFAELIGRLGIADMVNAKAVITPGGFTAARVASGEAEVAIQQLSELKAVAGVDIVGPLPRSLQQPSRFTVAVAAMTGAPVLARRLLSHIRSPAAREALAASGLEPLDPPSGTAAVR